MTLEASDGVMHDTKVKIWVTLLKRPSGFMYDTILNAYQKRKFLGKIYL